MPNDAEPTRRRVDPRPEQTRDLVLQAARMIISADGPQAVTPTRLVEMSGVARSTIYRHWPDADAVVHDALEVTALSSAVNPSGDPEPDLRSYLNELRGVLEGPGAAMIAAQVERAERDERSAKTLEGNGSDRNRIIKELLNDPRSDFAPVHASLAGPLFMQRFFIRKPITDELIEHVIETYFATLP